MHYLSYCTIIFLQLFGRVHSSSVIGFPSVYPIPDQNICNINNLFTLLIITLHWGNEVQYQSITGHFTYGFIQQTNRKWQYSAIFVIWRDTPLFKYIMRWVAAGWDNASELCSKLLSLVVYYHCLKHINQKMDPMKPCLKSSTSTIH